jgi:hypothetical protein
MYDSGGGTLPSWMVSKALRHVQEELCDDEVIRVRRDRARRLATVLLRAAAIGAPIALVAFEPRHPLRRSGSTLLHRHGSSRVRPLVVRANDGGAGLRQCTRRPA